MKKLLLSLALLLPFLASAQTVTLNTNSGASTWTGGASGYSTTLDGYTISYEKNISNNDCIAPSTDHIRVYKGANLIITAPEGVIMTKIVMTATGSTYAANLTDGSTDITTFSGTTITWTGSSNEFKGTASNKQVRIKSLEITYEKSDATIATPTFSVAAGKVEAGTQVELACATEGASIYYTLDGSAPTTDSTPYTGAITINEDCTVKAVAALNGDLSNVATANYSIIVHYDNLSKVIGLADGSTFDYEGQLTVTYTNGANVYVYDPVSKLQTLLYASNLGLQKGDVIAAGWTGTVSIFNGLFEIKPTGTKAVEGATGEMPKAIEIDATNFSEIFIKENMNNLVVIKNATVPEISAKETYDATIGDNTFAIRNNFTLTADAGNYDVEGFIAYYEKNGEGTVQLYPTDFYEIKPWTITTDYTCDYGILDLIFNTGVATIADGDAMITITYEGDDAPMTSTRTLTEVRGFDSTTPIKGYALDEEIKKTGEYTVHVPAGFFINANGVGNAEYTETLDLIGTEVWVVFPENGLRLITDEMATIGVIEQVEETVFSSDMQIGNDGEETFFFLAQNCELTDLDNQVYCPINVMDDIADADQITVPLNIYGKSGFPFMVKGGYYNVTVNWNSPDPEIVFTKTQKQENPSMEMPEKLFLMGWYANELTLDGKVFTAKNVSVTSAKEKLYFNADGEESNFEYGLADANVTLTLGEAYTLVSKGEPFTLAPGKYDVTVDWNGTAPVVTFTETVVVTENINIYWDNSIGEWKSPVYVYMTDSAYDEIYPNKELTPEGYYVFTIPSDALAVYIYDEEDPDMNLFYLMEGDYQPVAPVANGVYSEAGYLGIYGDTDYVTIYFDNTEAQWAQPYVMYSVDGATPYEIDMVPVVKNEAAPAITTYAVSASQLYRAELPANTTFFQFMDRVTGDDSYAHETPVNNTIYGLKDETMEYNDDNVTAIIGIQADTNAAARYFNLQGIEVKAPAAGQVYIMVQNGKSTKVVK